MEETTIAAIYHSQSASGIGIVRISGPEASRSHPEQHRSKGGKTLKNVPSHTIHYGYIYDNEEMVTKCWSWPCADHGHIQEKIP